MSSKKPTATSQPESSTLQGLITIRKADPSNNNNLALDQKLSFMQIRRRIFIHSVIDGDQDLRMAFFSLLFRSMTQPEARCRQLFDNIRRTFRTDGSNDYFAFADRGLEQAFGMPDGHVEKVLIDLFNGGFDKGIIDKLRTLLQADLGQNQHLSLQKIVNWLERKYATTMTVVPFSQSLVLSHSKPDLIDYKHKSIKQSAKPHVCDLTSESDSLLSIPKKEHTASDIIEITLSRSPTCFEECQGVAITEFRPPAPPKRKSFWDLLCCNE